MADSKTTKIYDIANDPLFGWPACVIYKTELCVTDCEFGFAGDCPRRLAEEHAGDELPGIGDFSGH